MFHWMSWTPPTAVFFVCMALLLAGMTLWEIRSPTIKRKGFLPMKTTRGDRLFIGLLIAAYVNLGFLGLGDTFAGWFTLDEPPSVWISFAVSMILLAVVMRKG